MLKKASKITFRGVNNLFVYWFLWSGKSPSRFPHPVCPVFRQGPRWQVISYGYRKLVDGEVPEMYRFQCSKGGKCWYKKSSWRRYCLDNLDVFWFVFLVSSSSSSSSSKWTLTSQNPKKKSIHQPKTALTEKNKNWKKRKTQRQVFTRSRPPRRFTSWCWDPWEGRWFFLGVVFSSVFFLWLKIDT